MTFSLPFPQQVRGWSLLAAFIGFWITAPARADIYRWTDRNGDLHYSNVPPAKEQSATNAAVVTKTSAVPAQPATPTQQELLARVQGLEHELHAQRVAATIGAAPSPPVVAYQQAPQPYQVAVPAYYPQTVAPAPVYDSGWGNPFDYGFYATPFAYPAFTTFSVFTPVRSLRSPFGRRGAFRPSFHAGFRLGHHRR